MVGWGAAISVLFWAALIWVAYIDFRHKVIPDKYVLITAFLGLLLVDDPWHALYGALLGGGVLLIPALIQPTWVGGGDIKLMAALGIAFGLGVMWVLWLACVLALIATLLFRKKSAAFAPYVLMASLIVHAFPFLIIYQ